MSFLLQALQRFFHFPGTGETAIERFFEESHLIRVEAVLHVKRIRGLVARGGIGDVFGAVWTHSNGARGLSAGEDVVERPGAELDQVSLLDFRRKPAWKPMTDIPINHYYFLAKIVPVIVQEFMVQVGGSLAVGCFEHPTNLRCDVQHLFHAQITHEITAGVAGIANQVQVIFPAALKDKERQPIIGQAFLELVQHVCNFIRLKNGQPAGHGFGSAVQGHPCEAVAWLANTLGKFDIPFRKGEIILSGALAPLVPVQPGDEVSLTLSGLGSANLRFVP